MNTDNTQDAAEPSPASAGSHNTHMATARLSAANTWLQEEIKRLRITDAEREAIERAADWLFRWQETHGYHSAQDGDLATLRGLLERTK